MAGVITTGNHPKALWPGIHKWWGRVYDEHPTEYTQIFDIQPSDKAYEEDVLATGFGLAPVKTEGGGTSYDSESQGFTKRYTHVAYSLGYIVTREELADSKYEQVSRRRSQAVAFSHRQTKENVHANILNRAFNSSFTGGDAKELLATDHSTKAGNQSNHIATAADMSEASIEDMVIQMMGATNDRGLQISIQPKCLIVPRQLWFDANRIINSVLQSNSAQNDINVLNNTGTFPDGIKVNHYLTHTDAFFLKSNVQNGLTCFDRESIEFTQDSEFDTDNAKAKCYERYSAGWTDWRTLYGSPGA